MNTRIIRQAVSEESLFRVLARWCQAGAGNRSHSLKILTAFVSNKGVEAIAPFIDIFLADGNFVEIIFGVDRGGTNRDAIRRLYSLQTAHAHRINVSIFRAPAAGSIFHPKLYIYEADSQMSFVIGSANLTLSGLGSNLESLLLYENVPDNKKIASDVTGLWDIFAKPAVPLPTNCLRNLKTIQIQKLINQLPVTSSQEAYAGSSDVSNLWRPLSRVPLPRSGVYLKRKRTLKPANSSSFLLMDVLQETRSTQMQIPLPVVEAFFRIPPQNAARVEVSVIAGGELTHPIDRPLVISSGENHSRLMRRLEMPQIKELDRPLAVLFLRLKGRRRFAYLIVPRNSEEYRIANKILRTNGQQGNKKRRYYIGKQGDSVWKEASRILA